MDAQTHVVQMPVPQAVAAEAFGSGVSWPAVFAGATVTAALAVVLVALGVGFGLESISPWPSSGARATTLAVASIVWLVAMQVIASSIGGYLAGRLRTKWARVHTDEVFFRDTAHGFLSWALASVALAAFLASGVAALGRASSAETASSAGQADRIAGAESFYVDALFRSSRPVVAAAGSPDTVRAEAGRVLTRILGRDDREADDRNYLVQLVSTRTGLGNAEATRQVDDVIGRARADLDAARKTAARISLWSFLALLIGAFCASYAATIGGRQRDHVVTI
jgi:hypothetical protein